MNIQRSLPFALCFLIGCSGTPTDSLPSTPSFEGRISHIVEISPENRRLYVDSVSTRDGGFISRVAVLVSAPRQDRTVIGWSNGGSASWNDLEVGQVARVWSDGVMLRSLPPQVYALRVTIASP